VRVVIRLLVLYEIIGVRELGDVVGSTRQRAREGSLRLSILGGCSPREAITSEWWYVPGDSSMSFFNSGWLKSASSSSLMLVVFEKKLSRNGRPQHD